MSENAEMVTPPARKWNIPLFALFRDISSVFKMDELGMEIIRIALPAAMAMAADPIASLIDTAFIGRLGAVDIAAVGVSIAIFNQASKVFIYPLVSVTTSFVAEEDTVERINDKIRKDELEKLGSNNNDIESNGSLEKGTKTKEDNAENEDLEKGTKTKEDNAENKDLENETKTDTCKSIEASGSNPEKAKPKKERRTIPSASTALLLGVILGLVLTMFLVLLGKTLLGIMGVKPGSPMLAPALKYLTIRSLGSTAVLLSLSMQGVFRGFKDTTTPLYATVAGDLTNIILDPIFIFVFKLGVGGAAIAHVISQYLICVILFVSLMKQVNLLPPSIKDLQFSKFLKNGILLLARVIAATIIVTLGASMATRLGPTIMAGFQICLQVWLASSLLADGLAVAGQAILACAFAEKDYQKATATAARVLQMAFVLGLGLALFVGLGLHFGSGMFTKDLNVIHVIALGIPFVAGTQPINSLAFVFDGVNFGASDFIYSAYSMILVAIVSIGSLFLLKIYGFIGIWIGLTIYMSARTFAGFWRLGTGTGPWHFLRSRRSSTKI